MILSDYFYLASVSENSILTILKTTEVYNKYFSGFEKLINLIFEEKKF